MNELKDYKMCVDSRTRLFISSRGELKNNVYRRISMEEIIIIKRKLTVFGRTDHIYKSTAQFTVILLPGQETGLPFLLDSDK